MAAIRDIAASAGKWVRNAAGAGQSYIDGVTNPRTSWAAAAAGASANYQAGVTAAATSGAFAAGVRRAGDAKWSQMAAAKGPGRFAEGVAIAKDAWQTAFTPFQAAISSLQLPARGPTGSAQNLQRVAAVATALRAVKMRGAGR